MLEKGCMSNRGSRRGSPCMKFIQISIHLIKSSEMNSRKKN